MATLTAQILIGSEHPYHGGMGPSHQLFLSENDRLDQDVMAVYEMGHVANRYFVMTELQDPAIVGMSNKELMGIVNPSNNPIKLIGGFLDKDRSALNRGCLGYFAYCLRRNGVQAEYIPELCFSRSNTIERKLD